MYTSAHFNGPTIESAKAKGGFSISSIYPFITAIAVD